MMLLLYRTIVLCHFQGIQIQIFVIITNLIIYLIILTTEVSLYGFWISMNRYTRAALMTAETQSLNKNNFVNYNT